VEYQVSASDDDGYAFGETAQSLGAAYLKIGSSAFTKPPYYMSGMVFRSVNIPQGVQIVSARLKIRSYNSTLTGAIYGKIEAEAADSSGAFGSARRIGSLPRTSASVNWDFDEPWSENTWYESPDIADVIQEVIDRGGWSAGNSLAILYSTRSKGGYRNFSAYDRGGDHAPKLEITYVPQ
jgi:type IV pilus assembly protein PilY1